jgi:peptide deformylase
MKLDDSILHDTVPHTELGSLMSNRRLADRMFRVMRREGGIGLAATQVGVAKRMFVMEVQGRDRACWNPEILDSSSEQQESVEGCLSFPGDSCTIKRPTTVRVRYYNCAGKLQEETLTGLEARCFQHELDHLDGITMWDRQREQNATKS